LEKQVDIFGNEQSTEDMVNDISADVLLRVMKKHLKSAKELNLDNLVWFINSLREEIHELSPFNHEPVDLVRWVKIDDVHSNDYNPNKVAPPEMELLRHSIQHDGYTQPVVTWKVDEGREVIDGFHRSRVCREFEDVNKRVHGYLPVVTIRNENTDKKDRIASTIRHNRARGKHQVNAMTEIVIELKNRNWRNARISKELGMDEEEVLRLCQISGLEDLFSDKDFSKAWVASEDNSEWEDITDEITEDNISSVRIPNEGKGDRIFHTYEKWECHKAGFYASNFEGMTAQECQEAYRDFLSDSGRFKAALDRVINEWQFSCEHYLTNFAMNRIAWLGQAAMCQATGIPSKYCSGFNLLTDEQKEEANLIALDALNDWLVMNDRSSVDMDEALSLGRQVEIY